jgi:hypothetical protein
MADDIKIKLGLDATELFNGITKATSELNKLAGSADKAETEIKQLDNQKVDIDTSEAESKLSNLAQQSESTSSGFLAGFGGGLAASGLSMLSDGIVSIAGKIKDGALAADEFGDTLEVAFTQQGIADVDGEIEKVRTSTLNLANDLGLPTERTRELASTVATMGGVAGSQAEELTKLSAGLEVFSGGAVKGEAVALAFSKGLADPEGAAAIEKLAKKYPQLAETLRSNIAPAEKMRQANLLLGDSFKTVADQQGDAGGSINKLQNQLGEAFQTIGAGVYDALGPIISDLLPILQEGIPKAMAFMIEAFGTIQTALSTVFGVVQPVLTFMYNNFDAISKVVGVAAIAFTAYSVVTSATTAVTAAYAAVQTALGGSISIATVAQYAWNLAMSLNPIGAVVAALALLGAGIYAVTEALNVSAEETREQAEANVEMIKTQKDANEEQTKAVEGTKTMAEEFLNLSKKKKLTADESKRLKELNGELNKEYPDLVKNTSNYKDNLDGVEAIANRAGTSLQGLAQESAKLDKALMQANQTLSFAKRNEAIEEALSTTKTGYGALSVVTDEYGNKAINAFAKVLYATNSQQEATDAYTKALKELGNNRKGIEAVSAAYNAQVAAMNAYKKTADTVVEVNKKLEDTTKPPPKGDAKPSGTTPESEYKKALNRYQSYLSGIEIYRKEQINKFEREGLDKEQIQLQLSQDPNAAPTAEALTKTIENTFGTTRDSQGNLVLGVKLGKDENVAEATLNVRKLLTEVGKFEVQINAKPIDFKDTLKEFDTVTKDIAKTSESLVPAVLATSQEALDGTIATVQQYIEFIKLQNDEIALKQAEAIASGNQEAADKFGESIQSNIQNINLLSSRLERFGTDSKAAIEKAARESTLEFQIQTALQTSILDAFNSEKIRKEKEANDAIREERLGALNAEEDDLTKSLAKREISFEDYAAKVAEIDAQRKQVEEQTEVTFLQRLKTAGDQAAASVLKSQSEIFKKNAQGMEGNQKVFNEFVGQTLEQFGTLAASGKATLADFGNAAAGAAFDAVSKMIPSFVVGILGSSITTLGPIAGPLIAATLTAGLQLLLANARGALGFKDGVVGLEGPGDERSDSIPAWLSKGESVITAAGTKANRQELEWMNNNPGMSIRDYFTSNAPQIRYSVQEDGNLIQEVRKLREETRGLGKQINRNTHVEISGALVADNNSIKAVIERDRRRNARRG